ncbi:two component transcriptional regulator, LuxR family [Nitrosomonas sp. Is79A3]|uniref:LuxR C-terminal-related transcriptional regulator n=1 Tax=Nitrosomonas sp. (strain Is79A3) TaxID=261292 RepID=UPI000215D27F
MNTNLIFKNILIVDDQMGERQEFKEKLLKLNPSFHITEAANDREAVNCLKTLANSEEGIELIFMDYLLPGSNSDGIGLARKIRTRYPKIMLYFRTAYYFTGNIEMMKEVADGIFYKDLTALEIMNRVGKNLNDDINHKKLTDREEEIMRLLADGNTNQTIADIFWTNNQIEDYFKKNYDYLSKKTNNTLELSNNFNFWPDDLEIQYYLRLAIKRKSELLEEFSNEVGLTVNEKAVVFRKAVRSLGYKYKQKYQTVQSEYSLVDELPSRSDAIKFLFNEVDLWVKEQIEKESYNKKNILKEDHLIKRFYEENYGDKIVIEFYENIQKIETSLDKQTIEKNADKFLNKVRDSGYLYPESLTKLTEKLSDYIKCNSSELDKQLKDKKIDNKVIKKLRTELDKIIVWKASLRTVERHCCNIIKVLGLAGRTELVNYATENYKPIRKFVNLPDILPVIPDHVSLEQAFDKYIKYERANERIPVKLKVRNIDKYEECDTEEFNEKLTDLTKSMLLHIGCKILSYIERQGAHQTDKIDICIQFDTSTSEITLLITATKKIPINCSYPDATELDQLMKKIGGGFHLTLLPEVVTFKAFAPLHPTKIYC